MKKVHLNFTLQLCSVTKRNCWQPWHNVLRKTEWQVTASRKWYGKCCAIPAHGATNPSLPFHLSSPSKPRMAAALFQPRFILFSVTTAIYGHYTGQPVLTGTQVKNWKILWKQSFTAQVPLLTATSTFGLKRNARVLNCVTYTVSVPSKYSHTTGGNSFTFK